MAFQYSTTVRNAVVDAVEATIGTSPILRIRSGAPPATCATEDSGTVLATMTLPSDWMSTASGGQKSKLGTWQDLTADATGTAGHFRIYDSGGTVCHMQGTVAAGGGDMSLGSTSITAGLQIDITSFTLTASGN